MFTADDARQLAERLQESLPKDACLTAEEAAEMVGILVKRKVLVDPSTFLILYYGPFPKGTRELLQEAGYTVKRHRGSNIPGDYLPDGVRITWPSPAV